MAKATAIYKSWVDNWACGSDKMLKWVVGANVPEIILNMLRADFNRQDWRRLQDSLTEISSKFSPPWVWKTLMSCEYRKIDQTNRALARRIVQDKGFFNIRERQLITHARYWIAVRILGYGEQELLRTLQLQNENFNWGRENFSYKVLKPFDDAFSYERKPGRPPGRVPAQIKNEKINKSNVA